MNLIRKRSGNKVGRRNEMGRNEMGRNEMGRNEMGRNDKFYLVVEHIIFCHYVGFV